MIKKEILNRVLSQANQELEKKAKEITAQTKESWIQSKCGISRTNGLNRKNLPVKQ